MSINVKPFELIQSAALRESEEVLASCTIAREKIQIGDYDGGCSVMRQWWKVGS
jgi:hypothetical protein